MNETNGARTHNNSSILSVMEAESEWAGSEWTELNLSFKGLNKR